MICNMLEIFQIPPFSKTLIPLEFQSDLCLEFLDNLLMEFFDNYSEDVDLNVDSLTNNSTSEGG